MTEQFFTRKEVANTLRVSLGTIDKLIHEGDLHSIKVVGRRRISDEHLRDYVEYLQKENDDA